MSVLLQEEIGNRIRDIRTRKKMSLEELSTRSGVSVTPLSKLERGLTNAKICTLFQVACALDVPLSVIVDINAAYIIEEQDHICAFQLIQYLKKLSTQQQKDIIKFLQAASEWGSDNEISR